MLPEPKFHPATSFNASDTSAVSDEAWFATRGRRFRARDLNADDGFDESDAVITLDMADRAESHADKRLVVIVCASALPQPDAADGKRSIKRRLLYRVAVSWLTHRCKSFRGNFEGLDDSDCIAILLNHVDWRSVSGAKCTGWSLLPDVFTSRGGNS